MIRGGFDGMIGWERAPARAPPEAAKSARYVTTWRARNRRSAIPWPGIAGQQLPEYGAARITPAATGRLATAVGCTAEIA